MSIAVRSRQFGSMARWIFSVASVVVLGAFSVVNAGDTYFTAKYQTPFGIPVGWGGFVLGAGVNRDNDMIVGLDVNLFSLNNMVYWGGLDPALEEATDGKANNWDFKDGDNEACFYGLGLSVGKIFEFSDALQFVSGWSVGYWYSAEFTYDGNVGRRTFTNEEDIPYTYVSTSSFLAHFIKARWKFLEVSYRMFLGDVKTTKQTGGANTKVEGKGRFGVTNHELALGVYFGK